MYTICVLIQILYNYTFSYINAFTKIHVLEVKEKRNPNKDKHKQKRIFGACTLYEHYFCYQ